MTVTTTEQAPAAEKVYPTIDQIRAHHAEGMTLVDIGKRYGCSDSTVARILTRAGVYLEPHPASRLPPRDSLAKMREKYSAADLAQMYECTTDAVYRRLSVPKPQEEARPPVAPILGPGENAADWPDAACLGADPELFFPDITPKAGALAEARRQAEIAKRYCQGCPRRATCLEKAGTQRDVEGVWGGEWFHNGERVAA